MLLVAAATRRAALASALGCLAASTCGPPRAAVAADQGTLRPDGIFADCSSACVSSQDDRPAVWDNPWIAEQEPSTAMKRLRSVVEKKLQGRVVEQDERYLRAEFSAKGPLGGESVDDAEFYFMPNDVLVQFRAARRGDAPDFGANRNRLEKARIALGWEKVQVLRNRRRALIVVESPFDSFGPATYDRDDLGFTNRDLVPAEANQRELYGELDPLAAPWRKPTPGMVASKEGGLGLGELLKRESDDRVRSK